MRNENSSKFDIPVNSKAGTVENPFVKRAGTVVRQESFEVDDVADWNPAVSSRFANRIPKQISRTVITVNERKLVFERSGGFFKLMGHLSDLVLLMFTATLISTAIGTVFLAGKITGAL